MVKKKEKKAKCKPAADMLPNGESQYGARTGKIKSESGNIMTELSAFNKFKFLEILRIQAPCQET